jgi:hypothetical protein
MDTSGFPCLTQEWRSCRTLADILAVYSYDITAISYLIAMGILAFGAYRAFKIRRALAQPIYRSRALWLSLMVVLYVITLIADLIPYPSTTDFFTAVLITLGFNLPYLLFALVMFVSVDRTILVAIDMDLLQRNTLQWPRLRLLPYAMVLGSVALILIANPFLFLVNTPAWANIADIAFYPVYLIPLVIATFTLFLSARRSLEETMARFATRFGLAVAFFQVDFILFNYVYYFYYNAELQFLDNLIIIAATYLLYRAIVSLTPLGRVERVEAAPTTV